MKRALFLVLLLTSTALGQTPELITKGTVDLPNTEPFSRPYTVFDQLLFSLQGRAMRSIGVIRPYKNDFRFSDSEFPSPSPESKVSYDEEAKRIGIKVSVFVTAMDNPWEAVCERHVKRLTSYFSLGMHRPGDSLYDGSVRIFFEDLLGPNYGDVPIESLRPFMDAIVVLLDFVVVDTARKKLAYLRQCAFDASTWKIAYKEFKYE